MNIKDTTMTDWLITLECKRRWDLNGHDRNEGQETNDVIDRSKEIRIKSIVM